MGFNLDALDGFEFEKLARDVTEKIVGVDLSCYTEGADGGVDASDYYYRSGKPVRVVMQAKHWSRYVPPSKWIEVVSRLCERLKKSNKMPSDKLVIVASAGITEDVQHKMIDVAESLGISQCIVVDRVKLDDFLQREEALPIIKRHFKLWTAGANILGLMLNRAIDIDTKVFLDHVDSHKGLYIQTSVFDKAIESLRRHSILLIVGDPGTGKSVLTQMIALQLIKANHKVVYSSCNDLNRIKNAIEIDCENTLFVLDDFLGQRCLDIDSSKMRGLVTLLRYISKMKNCYAVLNSRISILNEAKRIDDPFKRFIDNIRADIVVIDTKEMSILDKARIMLSNLAFEKVPVEYVDALKAPSSSLFSCQMKCIGLCEHNNFNPRIIEFCCRSEFWTNRDPLDFPSAIKAKLDHPNDVWQNEFEDRLGKAERILAYQLFSLGDANVAIDALRIAYEARMALEVQSDSSVNMFDRALKRLQDTIIKTVFIDNKPYVSMANPSVNDYCAWFLANNNLEASSMAKSLVYVDQLERIAGANQCAEVISVVRDAFVSNRLYGFPYADNISRLYELPGFKTISHCEGKLLDSDNQWIVDFIYNALESSDQEAWNLASTYLFGKFYKWSILDASQISELVNSEQLLRHLVAGTSCYTAPALVDALMDCIDMGLVDNPDVLQQVLIARSKEWLYFYAEDDFDDWFKFDYMSDIHERVAPCEDWEEWDQLVREDAEKQLRSIFDESHLKELLDDHLGAEVSGWLESQDYSNELEDAIDGFIGDLIIPDQDSAFESLRDPLRLSDKSVEITIVEKLFNEYRTE